MKNRRKMKEKDEGRGRWRKDDEGIKVKEGKRGGREERRKLKIGR